MLRDYQAIHSLQTSNLGSYFSFNSHGHIHTGMIINDTLMVVTSV